MSLSGRPGTELTNACTTGLLDTWVLKWVDQIGEALAVRIKMFPRLRAADEVAGPAVSDLGLMGFVRRSVRQAVLKLGGTVS